MSDRNIELTRRKILAGAGTIGAAGASAGLGTSALFSDGESFSNNTLEAGRLDLSVEWETQYDGPGDLQTESGTLDGDPAVLVDLGDLKPGDTGKWTFCFDLVDNPGYLWLGGALTGNGDNGRTEPEREVDLTGGQVGVDKGELADAIEVELAYEGGPTVTTGSLKSVLHDLQFGLELDGDPETEARACFPPDEGPCLVVDWELPLEVGNEIQGDSVGFGLQFFAQQCRNNDGSTNPTFDAVVASGDSIGAAVDDAGAGDVIAVEPGTFTEQVVVDKAVTLVGAGTGTTVVESPSSLSSRFTRDGDGNFPVVSLESDGAELWNLTVDGDRQGNGNNNFVGVAAYDAAVHVGNVEVTRVSDDPLSGVQHGLGIFAYNADGADRATVIEGCDVHDYQKGGIVAIGSGLDLCVLDSTVSGIGPTDKNGQNGIQVSGVAEAAIVGNTVVDNYYTGGATASGVIAYNASDVVVESNHVENNNAGLAVASSGNIGARQNNIVGNDYGALNYGATSFDATHNWWGAPDGPSGGETDPSTGATADGTGDSILTASGASIRWDPFATSQFSI